MANPLTIICRARRTTQGAPPRVNISLETLAIFLRVLGAAGALLPPELAQHLKLVQTAALQQHPQLASVVGELGPPETFAADIENEANAYFQRAYAGGGGREGAGGVALDGRGRAPGAVLWGGLPCTSNLFGGKAWRWAAMHVAW